MTVTAGQLDRVISIERRTVVREADYGSDGGRWETWAANVRAKVEESLTAPITNPTDDAMVAGYQRPHRVTIRWREFDKANMRLRYRGRVLKVIATAELGRREWLQIACQEWAHDQ